MSDPVHFERRGAVAYLTLNRPDSGNAIDVALARGLLDAAIAADSDPGVRCVVLRGNGRMFCAGGDVKSLHAVGEELPALLREILNSLHPAIERLASMEKPLITAIQGATAGAGVSLAAVGDVALAEPQAHFTLAYSRIGLTPDGGATWMLPRLIGLRRTQELALTNRRLSAAEAAAMGLITRVVEPGTLALETDALARKLAASAFGAIGKSKRLLLEGDAATLGQQLANEREVIADQGASSESREGLSAFVERRDADFLAAALAEHNR